MKTISLLAIDLSKRIFVLHGVDEKGRVVLKKKLSRSPLIEFTAKLSPCTIAMEACCGCHYWARVFGRQGHQVRLMAAKHVKPYCKAQKNDANDAEAIAEATARPRMRFINPKSRLQQDVLCLHRVRERFVHARVGMGNQIRGILAEYGVVIARSPRSLKELVPRLLEGDNEELSLALRQLLSQLFEQYENLAKQEKIIENQIKALHVQNDFSLQLAEVPGIGALTASAFCATIGDVRSFKNGRELAAYLGLVPRQYSSGGHVRLGGITKQGDVYLRKLLIHGARSVIRHALIKQDPLSLWIKKLYDKKGYNKTAVALAHKNVRVVWAILAHHQPYCAA